MDIEKEREAFQNFCEQNFDVERHEQTYFDEQTQSYENDLGECTESINMAWMAWQTKAQAVPERTNQTFEDWLSDPENTKVYFGGYRERANEFAHQAWMASLKAKLPKDKILMPRSLDQKHIDYVVHQLAISSGASLISEVYECLIEAQEPANDSH